MQIIGVDLQNATTDGCYVECRDRRDCRENIAARRRVGARVLLDSPAHYGSGDGNLLGSRSTIHSGY